MSTPQSLLPISTESFRNQYLCLFGEIKHGQQIDATTIEHIFHYAGKQPNSSVNQNIYLVPSGRLERWKWILGLENNLDKKVKQNHDNAIHLLENTKATSIIQLKNQMTAFWHTDRQVVDYEKFKKNEKDQATSRLINKIFFLCLGFLLKFFYNPSNFSITRIFLKDKSNKTFVKIGGFKVGNTNYKVVAKHPLTNEKDSVFGFKDDEFNSLSSGKTYVGICKEEETQIELGHRKNNHNFAVLIGRKPVNNKSLSNYYVSENSHGGEAACDREAVLENKRYLIVDLDYRDGSNQNNEGSDRLLDQKLTQIMIEMLQQNKNMTCLNVSSKHDDLPVLIAGGFEHNRANDIMKELKDFRTQEGNKLFPPYYNYGGSGTKFHINNIDNKNVYYTKDGDPKSWSGVIARELILKQGAGVLPEYWVKKPNIVA